MRRPFALINYGARRRTLITQPESNSSTDKAGRADRFERRPTDRVCFIEQILHGNKCLDLPAQFPRGKHIDERKRAERQLIPVIIELTAGGAELHRYGGILRI